MTRPLTKRHIFKTMGVPWRLRRLMYRRSRQLRRQRRTGVIPERRSLADDPAAVERACIKQYGKREWCMWGDMTRDDARTDMQDVLRAAEKEDTDGN